MRSGLRSSGPLAAAVPRGFGDVTVQGIGDIKQGFLAVVCCTWSSPFQVPAEFRRVNVGTLIRHLFSLPASVICHMYVSFGIEAQRS